MILDFMELKKYIEESGLKQKALAEKAGLTEVRLCLILQGKRKLEVGEYFNICDALDVPLDKFVKKTENTKLLVRHH